ncbi:AAA family ATPase [Micromonospora krabiensis]|uniref:AAA domain-containing protein n=1 Tax=Micromonospora krabiensis TaxID=307121 RepID=A0A1C3NC27_9ACTN|nr:AAA family ATPase [Micromonospora krabiensis]SBV30146.1 AAA domain-containing protein [Micromonospora krabiensis]
MTANESGPLPSKAANANSSPESIGIALSPEETARALDIARRLVKAGIPVFSAAPNSSKPGTFLYPNGWEGIRPDESWIDGWKPGFALCAIGGYLADILDVDPRNGGDASAEEVRAAGQWPRSFGQQATPSGGTHDLISATGEHKATDFMPGLDLQSGAPDGTGRGFAFIAPTVRPSKVDGVARPYRWIVEPDVEALAEFRGADDSTAGIVARVHAKRDRRATPSAPALTGDVAGTPEVVRRVTQLRDELAAAPEGGGNNLAARLAWNVGQYVGAGQIDREQAAEILLSALDGWTFRHPADRGAMENTIRSQIEKGMSYPRPWEVAPGLDATGQGGLVSPAAPRHSGRLRAALLKRSELGKLPVPVPLITDVMHRETIVVLAGKFGSYKSFVTVGMGCSLASGTPWMGHEVPEAVPVLYVAAEGAYGIRKRVDAWEAAHGPVPDSFYLLPVPARLLVPEDVAEVDELIGEFGIKVLIVDTLHASAPGADEDKSKEIGPMYDTLRGLRERHGVTTILVHHTGHAGERARGSSSIEDDADTSFLIKLDGDGRDASTQRTLHHRKAKDGALLEPVPLKLTLVPGTDSGYVESGEVPSPNYLPDGLAAKTLIGLLDELGLPQNAGRDQCRAALAKAKVKARTELLAEAVRRRKAGETGQVEGS